MNPKPHSHFFLNFTYLRERARACSVADPHHLYADSDPACLSDPDPAPAWVWMHGGVTLYV
jgi:hypothetical protein